MCFSCPRFAHILQEFAVPVLESHLAVRLRRAFDERQLMDALVWDETPFAATCGHVVSERVSFAVFRCLAF